MSDLAKTTTASIVSTLRYRDAPAAIEWLERAFGFRRHFVVPDGEGGVAHAQLTFGNGMVMVSSARDDEFGRLQRPLESRDAPVSQSPYVIVTDVDAHHARALAAGGGRAAAGGQGLRRSGLRLPGSGRQPLELWQL